MANYCFPWNKHKKQRGPSWTRLGQETKKGKMTLWTIKEVESSDFSTIVDMEEGQEKESKNPEWIIWHTDCINRESRL